MIGARFVKFCGITRSEDAGFASRLGIDALGFNFWSSGPRAVVPGVARAIVEQLPEDVRSIGVFVNETPSRIASIVREVGLDGVQLHGDEPPEACEQLRALGVPWICKAFRMEPDFDPVVLSSYPCDGFVLDGFDRHAPGGTGKTFDWTRAREACTRHRVLVAGGLSPRNVTAAIRGCMPWGVDVASGIERAPGVKDPQLMLRFVEAVRQAERQRT